MTVTTVVLIMTVVIPLYLCVVFFLFFPLQKTTSHMKCMNLPVKDIAL